jgi:hypothetical protein
MIDLLNDAVQQMEEQKPFCPALKDYEVYKPIGDWWEKHGKPDNKRIVVNPQTS